MKRVKSIIRDIVFVIFVLAICGVIFMLSTGRHISIGGYQVLRVITSSMEPAISENTCILIKDVPVEQLKVGDIITFFSDDPDIQGYYNTHRIQEIVVENGETIYITKGDSNMEQDTYPVHQDQIAGIFVKEITGGKIIGKLFIALSDNRVYFFVVMLPLTICLLSYLWQIIMIVTNQDESVSDEEPTEAYEKGSDEPDE